MKLTINTKKFYYVNFSRKFTNTCHVPLIVKTFLFYRYSPKIAEYKNFTTRLLLLFEIKRRNFLYLQIGLVDGKIFNKKAKTVF